MPVVCFRKTVNIDNKWRVIEGRIDMELDEVTIYVDGVKVMQ